MSVFVYNMPIQIENLLKIHALPPDELSVWLSHNSSLTEKLKMESGDAELQVLNQSWSQPNWWDKFTLGLGMAPVLHRDILMLSQQVPAWFARTIIPESCFKANQQFFERLKDESLGVIVFNEPEIIRTHLLNYAINSECLEYQWLPDVLKNTQEPLWLRFSVFTVAESATFYLVEILLPGLLKVMD